MNRNEEYESLLSELNDTPAALEFTVTRAKARAKRARVGRLFGIPVASLAGVFSVFVLLVNVSTPFALACGTVPILKELTAAVAFSPSLKTAVANDYVQYIGQSQTVNGITLQVEYVIVDQKQVNIFFSLTGGEFECLMGDPHLTDADGRELYGCCILGDCEPQRGVLRKVTVEYDDNLSVPAALNFGYRVRGYHSDTDPYTFYTPQEEPYLAEFSIPLTFDPRHTAQGRVLELHRDVVLDGQTITVEGVEVYPTHIRLLLSDHPENTAWLKSLEFYLEDENGNRYEKISNGITASGSTDTPFMNDHRLESSFFGDATHLTLHFTGATWLEKNMEWVEVDLKNKTAGPLPPDIRLDDVAVQGTSTILAFSSPCTDGVHRQLFGWKYRSESGDVSSYGSRTHDLIRNRNSEQLYLEDYSGDIVYLALQSSRETPLDLALPVF